MDASKLKRGDWVIYRKQKSSTSPGARATDVHPTPGGDTYHYLVDKFWVVEAVLENQQILLRTRRGKQHTIDANDPRLRRASWWERLMYRSRFTTIEL
ncbi:hypothetical protein CA51_48020 [Rosistilla oblonga]|uniref:Uncharacterized protein n=1 Tax=Rosistilla oblonga TaxID=2527990 RepID=A0A518IV34_9BACT|nr:hypothetical protein [Rosistilla oblonga]QDV14892.1 hypothetical protein CA51_48020 [Rosistilla oblonga]QDV56953.1 hypothetical protein Mal33_29540 [Rosistilla oblonga]